MLQESTVSQTLGRSVSRIASNELQDEVGLAAQSGRRIKEFFDLLTGVENYAPHNLDRQGVIRIWFAKDLIRHQFLIDFEDIVQEFLRAAVEELPNAVPRGTIVDTPNGPKPTQRNIISRCQHIARMKTRAYINAIYRNSLIMVCAECGKIRKANYNKECGCGSTVKMETQHVYANIEDSPAYDARRRQDDQIEVKETEELYLKLVRDAHRLFDEGSRAQQIFNLLMNPDVSKEMCKICVNRSRTRVVGRKSLPVIKESDVRELYRCDADFYDPTQCTNTSKNFAAFLGVSKSLVDDKIRLIRKRIKKYIAENKRNNDFLCEVAGRMNCGGKS